MDPPGTAARGGPVVYNTAADWHATGLGAFIAGAEDVLFDSLEIDSDGALSSTAVPAATPAAEAAPTAKTTPIANATSASDAALAPCATSVRPGATTTPVGFGPTPSTASPAPSTDCPDSLPSQKRASELNADAHGQPASQATAQLNNEAPGVCPRCKAATLTYIARKGVFIEEEKIFQDCLNDILSSHSQ